MEKQNYTAGWWVQDDANPERVAVQVHSRKYGAPVYEYIAACDPEDFSTTVRSNDEIHANAKAIAATPKLIEACWELIRAHDLKMGKGAVKLRIEIARDALILAGVKL